MLRKSLTIGLVVVLTLVVAGTAMAADPFMETGAVASVDAASFELDVAGTLYTVLPPAGFDLTTLTVGEIVVVTGEVELGVVTATSIVETGLMAFHETGTVAAIGAATFELDVAGTLYTILPPAGFDLTTLTVGDTVEVEGTLDATNVVTATSITLAGPAPFSETGEVISIGVDSFEFDVAGTLYTVLPPAGFDLTTLMAGDIVMVEGTVELNVVTATSITLTGLTAFSETGTVASIGVDSFELDVAGMLYTVLPPAGFDLTTLMVGDTVEVEGTIDSTGLVTATSIVIVTEEEEVEYLKDGFYCENPDATHPVIQKIADKNSVSYEEVLAFFCGTDEIGHHGLGAIMLAYATANSMGEGTTAADILQMREEIGGWGKVWQELGLKGNKHNNTADDGEDSEEELATAGDEGPSNNGNGNGKGNNGKGKPDHAGPPEHAKNKNKNKP